MFDCQDLIAGEMRVSLAAFSLRPAVRKSRQTGAWKLTTAIVFSMRKSQLSMAKSNLWPCPTAASPRHCDRAKELCVALCCSWRPLEVCSWRARLSPWVALGGGYALYEQSTQFSNGENTTNKFLNRGVFDFDGGLDYKLFRFLGLRAEVRDLVSGNPNLNVALSSSVQHNLVSSGGISVRF